MCGLVGYNGSERYNIDKIKLLMLYNESRGKDSCGFYTNAREYGITKVLGEASKNLLPVITIPNGTSYIGHLRAASVGLPKTKESSHPFREGHIIGAHNGKIDNWREILKEFELPSDIQVDSHALFAAFAKSTPINVIKGSEGAAALIWIDVETPDITYCYRSSERPLFRGMIGEGMYISSMEEALKAIECTSIKEFKEGYLYTLEGGKIKDHKAVKMKTKVYEHYSYSTDNNTSHISHRVHHGQAALPLTNIIGKSELDKIDFINDRYSNSGIYKNKYNFITFKAKTPIVQQASTKEPETSKPIIKISKNQIVQMDNNNSEYEKSVLENQDGLGIIACFDSLLEDLNTLKEISGNFTSHQQGLIAAIENKIKNKSSQVFGEYVDREFKKSL